MPNGLEIAGTAKCMVLAEKENATGTYAEGREHLPPKAILTVAGVNLAGIDRVKE